MTDATKTAPAPSAGRKPDWPFLGYAPGFYMGECGKCGEEMIADKRASQCLACAIDVAKAEMKKLPPRKMSAQELIEMDAIVERVTTGFRTDVQRILKGAS